MPEDAIAKPVEQLLTEAQWVRGLAQRLAARSVEADDLVQDAWLAAMQRPPGERDNLRGWFATVLRNLVRQRHRQSTRRRAREDQSSAGRPAAEPPTADLVERAATQRAVVDAVIALDEPYRSTILLRFFEDLPPREIAARQGIPVATVHTHLTRGLERLRRRLDQRHGGRAAWVAALSPLTPISSSVALLGLLAMKTKLLATCAIAVGALAIILGTIEWADPAAARTADRDTPPPAQGGVVSDPAPGATAVSNERIAFEQPVVAPTPRSAEPPPRRLVSGRTVDPEGQPLPELAVAFAADDGRTADPASRVTSDHDGRFTLPVPADTRGRIVAVQPGWGTVLSASLQNSGVPQLALVVAAPLVELAGVVRSDDGRAIDNAHLRVVWPDDLRARLSDISDAATEEAGDALTATDGAFVLRGARVRGATVLTTAAGFLTDRRELPQVGSAGLEIVLARPVARAGALQGQVVDWRGLPIAGASVTLGGSTVASGDDGSFLVEDGAAGTLLAAAHAGHRRGVLERPTTGWPAFVVLPLGPAPLSIRGRVLDAEGAPVVDAKVWMTNATPHGESRRPEVCEGIAAGRTGMGELIASFRRGEVADPEAAMRRTPTTTWPFVFTDAAGRFDLPGLEDRPYDLRVMDMDTLLMVDAPAIPAGASDVAITLPSAAMFAAVAGVVVGGDGVPVAGASITAQCDALRIGNSTMHSRSQRHAVTDERGRFRIEKVPHTQVYLRIDGELILPIEYGRGVEGGLLDLCAGDADNLMIVVQRRMHVQVELGDPALAEELLVLDAEARPLDINVFVGRGRNTVDVLPLELGKSPVFVVPDTAATIVLRKAGREVRREALVLRSGEVNKLTY